MLKSINILRVLKYWSYLIYNENYELPIMWEFMRDISYALVNSFPEKENWPNTLFITHGHLQKKITSVCIIIICLLVFLLERWAAMQIMLFSVLLFAEKIIRSNKLWCLIQMLGTNGREFNGKSFLILHFGSWLAIKHENQ